VKQGKAGFNLSGSQRYRCGVCHRVYTPEPNLNGYPAETHMLAIRMHLEGNSKRAIGRVLKVNHQTVVNWVADYISKLPPAEAPERPEVAELDELYSFVEQKKT
jgi:transposase-like protein